MSSSCFLLKKTCYSLLRISKLRLSWIWGPSMLLISLMICCCMVIYCERFAICSSTLVWLASSAFSYSFLRCNCRLLPIFWDSNWVDTTFNFCFRTAYRLEFYRLDYRHPSNSARMACYACISPILLCCILHFCSARSTKSYNLLLCVFSFPAKLLTFSIPVLTSSLHFSSCLFFLTSAFSPNTSLLISSISTLLCLTLLLIVSTSPSLALAATSSSSLHSSSMSYN